MNTRTERVKKEIRAIYSPNAEKPANIARVQCNSVAATIGYRCLYAVVMKAPVGKQIGTVAGGTFLVKQAFAC